MGEGKLPQKGGFPDYYAGSQGDPLGTAARWTFRRYNVPLDTSTVFIPYDLLATAQPDLVSLSS